MGYYIQTPENLNKAEQLCQLYGAECITVHQAEHLINDPELAPVCVVMNGFFDAAGFCFDEDEFKEFSKPDDFRPKQWLSMNREVVKTLSGFRG